MFKQPRMGGADSDSDRVFGKAGKKRRVLCSPVHCSALLNNNSCNSQCSVSLGCGVYYTARMGISKEIPIKTTIFYQNQYLYGCYSREKKKRRGERLCLGVVTVYHIASPRVIAKL